MNLLTLRDGDTMAKILQFSNYINIDDEKEPCSICNDRPSCKKTCKRAEIWWDRFGERMRKSIGKHYKE